jgi:ferredoxin
MWSFESMVRLGWSMVKTLVRSVFARRRELPRFMAQYRPDGMLTREPGDHNIVVGAGRCIGCGACDVVAIERGVADALGPRGPMAFVQGVSRQAGIDDPVEVQATPELLTALTVACPVGVPFVPLVQLVKRRYGELATARALPAYRESIVPPGISAG